MTIFLEIIFVALVIADTVLTYKVLAKAKGGYRETMPMRYVIKYPAAAITITMVAVGALLLFLAWAESYFEIPAFLILIPGSGVFAWASWRSWRFLHG
jgi:hypothetical protein